MANKVDVLATLDEIGCVLHDDAADMLDEAREAVAELIHAAGEVAEEHFGVLDSTRHEGEDDMLEGAASEVTPASRLSCQIRLTPDLDGLVVHLPDEQF